MGKRAERKDLPISGEAVLRKVSQEKVLDEYAQIGANWKYWGEARFKQLTVFLTVSGVLAAGVFSETVKSSGGKYIAWIRAGLCSLGLAVALMFFVLEERATYYRRAYMSCAVALEPLLRFGQYQATKHRSSRLDSPLVFRLFYTFVGGTWSVAALFVVTKSAAISAWGLAALLMFLPLWLFGSKDHSHAMQAGVRALGFRAEEPADRLASLLASADPFPDSLSDCVECNDTDADPHDDGARENKKATV